MTELLAFIFGASLTGGLLWLVLARRNRLGQKQQEQLLRRTKRAERLAELGTLVGHLAHELRNPLSIIKVNLKLLSEEIARQNRDLEGVDPEKIPIENLSSSTEEMYLSANSLIWQSPSLPGAISMKAPKSLVATTRPV